MKIAISLFALFIMGYAPASWAQVTNAPALPAVVPTAPVLEDPPILAKPTPERIPLIVYDSELPLVDVIKHLSEQAGLSLLFDSQLMGNGQPVPSLQVPVGVIRYEDRTARQALVSLLEQNKLRLGQVAGNPQIYVTSHDSDMIPVEEELGSELDEGAELENMLDPNKEYPLLTMIQILGKFSKLNILIDPRLKTGMKRYMGTGTNMVEIDVPPVATNTVSLGSFGGVTPRQTLEALLTNYGLTILHDPKTSFSQVTYKDPAAKEPVYTYVHQLRYSNATNLVTLINLTFPHTKVQADTRTAQLILLATQKEYDAITNLVLALDTPTRQVLIEARFLETFTNPKSVKGLDWTDTLSAQNITMGNGLLAGQKTRESITTTPGSPVSTTLPSGRTVTTTPASDTKTISSAVTTSTLDSQAVSLTSAGGFSPNVAFLQADGVKAVLSFLNSESDSRVLATPRAVTVDNQETRLEVTRSIPIFDASESVGSGGTAVSSSKPNYTNVGTILVVTPRITGTNVAMKVRPEISRVEPLPSRKVVAGKVNEADIFSTSKIETSVMIPSGHTLVMGGLISDSTQKSYTKVPFLGDIPGLGWAFRKESKENTKANLIIFVTPTIIEDEDYQPYRTEFLNTKMPEHDATLDEKPWNRGKPWNYKGKKDKEKVQDEETRK